MDPLIAKELMPLLGDHGLYVEVGAHDGRSSSNTLILEKRGWRGILIEPVLHNYFKMLQARSPENIFVHAACVGFNFPKPSIKLIYGGLMTLAPEISNLDEDEWVSGSKEFLPIDEHTLAIYAPAKTLNSILNASNYPSTIDFLSIDVEGAELEVLSGIDFNAFRFKIICMECKPNDESELLLLSLGYELLVRARNNSIFGLKV
jgi:FkbM family methyltransferase